MSKCKLFVSYLSLLNAQNENALAAEALGGLCRVSAKPLEQNKLQSPLVAQADVCASNGEANLQKVPQGRKCRAAEFYPKGGSPQ
jgi:hypothetical protein